MFLHCRPAHVGVNSECCRIREAEEAQEMMVQRWVVNRYDDIACGAGTLIVVETFGERSISS